jgi:hypothetical protein
MPPAGRGGVIKAKRGIDSQLDLFVPFLLEVELRDQTDLMERPFFSLSKNKRLKEINYVSPSGTVFVNVKPHQLTAWRRSGTRTF